MQVVLSNAASANNELETAHQQTDESATVYDDVGVTTKGSDTKAGQDRIGIIQGRDLPSLPPREDNMKSSYASKPSLNSLSSISTFACVGISKAETGIHGQMFSTKQSNDELSGDDFYQELHSPSKTGTPYSSIESIQSTGDDADNMYNSIENVSEEAGLKPETQSDKEVRSRGCSEVFNWPPPPPDEELPVYDVPAAAVRPIAAVSASQNIFRCSAANLIEDQELYDVPVATPRPIPATPEKEAALEAYDQITTPPRPIATSNQNSAKESKRPQVAVGEKQSKAADPTNQDKAPMNKTARFWHDKIHAGNKKDTLPPVKCLPQPQPESKSVGRSCSRLSPPRAPLASLTELLSSSNGGMLKPSAMKKNFNGINSTSGTTKTNEERYYENNSLTPKPALDKKLPSIILDNNPNQKKERPPRPPAPVRTIPIQKAGEAPSLLAELKRRQMVPKVNQSLLKSSEKKSEHEKQPEPVTPEKTVEELSYGQYKARWAYVASNILELSINSGEVVEVCGKNGPCWLVRARNKKGLVPKEYLVPVENDPPPLPMKGEIAMAV